MASYDPLSKTADIIVDGSGTTNVTVTGLSGLGSSVTAQVESTSTPHRFTAVTAPTVLSQQTLPVSGGQVTVQIPNMSASRAYQVLLRPADGSGMQQLYYAANASLHNASIVAQQRPPRRMATTLVA